MEHALAAGGPLLPEEKPPNKKKLSYGTYQTITMDPNHTKTLEQRRFGDLSWYYLPVSLSSDHPAILIDFQTHILPLVRRHWSTDALRYRVFEDGVTNKLFGFYQVGQADDDMVLVRVNGDGRDLFVDSRMEILVMLTLHRAGLNPPLYLATRNGMCYGYIPGRALTSSEMQREEVLEATAHTMARFHSVPLPPDLQTGQPQVWCKVDNWMKLVTDDFHDDASAQRFRQVMGSLEDLRREMEWLKSYLGASAEHRMNGDYALLNGPDDHHHACDSVCVLCHNDAQPLNFVQTPNGDVVLIDMEYSGLNYPAFDIGCFFCEFAGVHGGVDYSRYPSEEIQKKWIYHYLKELARLKGEEHKTIPSEQVHRLYRDANQFALVAHFMWTLWSLIQCKHSTIHFDYLEYGCARYTEYRKRKPIVQMF